MVGKNRYKIIDDYVVLYLDKRDGTVLETYIDLEDFERVQNFGYKWCADLKKKLNRCYVIATVYLGIFDGKPRYNTVFLHRFIMNAKKG